MTTTKTPFYLFYLFMYMLYYNCINYFCVFEILLYYNYTKYCILGNCNSTYIIRCGLVGYFFHYNYYIRYMKANRIHVTQILKTFIKSGPKRSSKKNRTIKMRTNHNFRTLILKKKLGN
jgi:hypothetical protein